MAAFPSDTSPPEIASVTSPHHGVISVACNHPALKSNKKERDRGGGGNLLEVGLGDPPVVLGYHSAILWVEYLQK